jgi:hypothetical protein
MAADGEAMIDRCLIASISRKHGLGNGMRVLLSAQSYADHTGRRFAFTWPVGRALGLASLTCGLTTADDASPPLSPASSARYSGTRDPGLTEVLKDDALVLNVRAVHALTLPAGATATSDLFRQLTPVRAIVNRVHAFWDRHLAGGPYVGVMLRAHPRAHKTTKATSPPEWFIRRMLQIREGAPDIRFFPSCDYEATQGRVSDAVPGVLSIAKGSKYKSARGGQDGVADLYRLAGSSYLIGPHWSSLLDTVVLLGGPRLYSETAVSRGNAEASLCLGRLVSNRTKSWRL